MLRAALVIVFIPVLYLTASSRLVQDPVVGEMNVTTTLSIGTPQQADQLESQLVKDPNNLKVRSALMAYYANQNHSSAFTRHMLWVIDHNPEAPFAAMTIYPRPDSPLLSVAEALAEHSRAARDYEQIKAAWEKALSRYPNSAQVKMNAGLFLERSDAKGALNLFNQAKDLTSDGSNQTDQTNEILNNAIARIYAAAFMIEVNGSGPGGRSNNIAMDESFAGTLISELEASGDPALLSQVGTTLVQLRQDAKGLSLIQRAIDLDSANPRWKEALDSAKVEPIRRKILDRVLTGKLPQ